MTVTEPLTDFGRVKTSGTTRRVAQDLRDPKVVDAIWRNARREAAAEARPDWLNSVLGWIRRGVA